MLNRIALAVAVVLVLTVAATLILHALGLDVLRLDVAVFCGLFVGAHVLAEVEARHDAAQHLHVRYQDAKTSRAWHLWDAAQIGLWLAVAVVAVWVGRAGEVGVLDVVAALVLYVGARAWWFDGRRNVLTGHRWTYVGTVDVVDTVGGSLVGRALPAVRFGMWVLGLAAGAVLVLG